MRRAIGTLLVLLLAAVCASGAASAQSPRVLAEVDEWTKIVLAHRAGTVGSQAREIAFWPWTRIQPVLHVAKERAPSDVLLRAAAMYLDIAVTISEEQRPPYPTGGYQNIVATDGRTLRLFRLDPHLWWGRWLVMGVLDRESVSARDYSLAVAWFRTAAALFAGRLYLGDLEPHFEDALRALPNEPGVLFDAGCHAEALASPLIQAGMHAPLPAEEAAGARVRARRPVAAEPHLRTAERHFRASLTADPGATEARVRLGHVLWRLGRTSDAIRELEAGARSARDPEVMYYARLFLGAALTDVQRYDDALEAFADAEELFAAASSPKLGISRVHAERGDTSAARAAVSRMLRVQTDRALTNDPRWLYERCAGRNDAGIYKAFSARLRGEMR